jgi:hypothetical protein
MDVDELGGFEAPTGHSSRDKKLKRLALPEAERDDFKRQRQDMTYSTGVRGTDVRLAYNQPCFI